MVRAKALQLKGLGGVTSDLNYYVNFLARGVLRSIITI